MLEKLVQQHKGAREYQTASSYMKGIKMEGKFSPGSFLLYMAHPLTNMKGNFLLAVCLF
jgi:hypothetical protein